MFQSWRIKLREAERALQGGRLDEASRLLCQGELREFLPAKRLAAQVADRMAQRARSHAARGESMAGWRDLEAAAHLGADNEAVGHLRCELVEHGLAEAETYLAAGDSAAALARLEELERRQSANSRMRGLRQAAVHLDAAKRLCRRGRFAQAETELAMAAALRPDMSLLEAEREACRLKAAECRRLAEALHQAIARADWTAVAGTAEQLLQVSPEDGPARDARRRAWAAVGMKTGDSIHAVRASVIEAELVPEPARTPHAQASKNMNGSLNSKNHDAPRSEPGPRFLLWVDAVGGFLVCLGNEITLGQPVPTAQPDVPILGDLSSRHARIRRDGETYLIEPLRKVAVNGRTIQGPTSLVDGQRIELGEGVQLVFRRPHPLSVTARLDFVSRHRTQPPVDGVVLMGDSCVLGPNKGSHIPCPDWPSEVVLFRQGEQLFCRAAGRLEIDGTACDGRGAITCRSRIAGDDFSLSLEEV
jgi:hypothetical protein